MSELKIPAQTDRLNDVLDFLHAELESLDAEQKLRFDIDLVAEEIFVNIANYAYGGKDGEAVVSFEADVDKQLITLIFSDSGKPFDPTAAPPPDLLLPADERPIGGLGIFLVKKIMDSVKYVREDERNVLTMQKTYTLRA